MKGIIEVKLYAIMRVLRKSFSAAALALVLVVSAKCTDDPNAGKSLNQQRYEQCVDGGRTAADCRAITGF